MNTMLNNKGDEELGIFAHIVALIACIFSGGTLGFFITLGVWFLIKDRNDLGKHGVVNALNIQLMVCVAVFASVVLIVFGLGLFAFILIPLSFLAMISFHIMDIMKIRRGEFWNPPFVVPFFKG